MRTGVDGTEKTTIHTEEKKHPPEVTWEVEVVSRWPRRRKSKR
jgi:hypothetical protein